MAGLYISEERGILLRAALMLLPEKYRLSHIPFRVNTRKGDDVCGTVVFRGMERSWSKYFDLVALELKVFVSPAYDQQSAFGYDGEELMEIEFRPRLVKLTTRKSRGGAWLE